MVYGRRGGRSRRKLVRYLHEGASAHVPVAQYIIEREWTRSWCSAVAPYDCKESTIRTELFDAL